MTKRVVEKVRAAWAKSQEKVDTTIRMYICNECGHLYRSIPKPIRSTTVYRCPTCWRERRLETEAPMLAGQQRPIPRECEGNWQLRAREATLQTETEGKSSPA